jgi:hypothetical protein
MLIHVVTIKYHLVNIYANHTSDVGKSLNGRWMGVGQSEDMDDTLMDQDEDLARNERLAIADPNRYGFRHGTFTVYK